MTEYKTNIYSTTIGLYPSPKYAQKKILHVSMQNINNDCPCLEEL